MSHTSMGTARTRHATTLLADGTVLVTGGFTGFGGLASAQIYNPDTRKWKVAGSMNQARIDHTATTLQDGRVLIWGGPGSQQFPLNSIPFDLFDPVTKTCASLLTSELTRMRHTATLLPDGKVLIAGGEIAGEVLDTAQIFDPVMNVRTFVKQLQSARGAYSDAALGHALRRHF